MTEESRKNLINLKDRTPEERKRIATLGGKARAESAKRRKTLKEQLLLLLEDEKIQSKITTALVNRALNEADAIGNKAYEIIRDTIGEKEPEVVNIGNNSPADELLSSIENLKNENK